MDVQKILVPVDYSEDSRQALQWGTHGRTGLRHLLLGSVAEAVTR
jgi:hypothetical protein